MMKKPRIRRSLALLLAIVMCIGMLPMHALAAQPNASSGEEAAVQGASDVIVPAGVTAGSTYGASTDVRVELIIDGSGMSDGTLDAAASSGKATYWHTENNPGANAWVKVDLGQVYQLDELWVWNMNQNEGHSNRGFKNVKIEYATEDGNSGWTELTAPDGMTFTGGDPDYPFQFAQASGADGQKATNLNDGSNTPVAFDGAKARYVKITANPTAGNGS